ncbi:FAD binding domain-containing protein [Geopyxis carbonaria]|nr:FAD binding domain-containing protein [Geopyxis carbonaria]
MSPGLSNEYPPAPHPERKRPDASPVVYTDVLIVGAGPAGLMLATQLTRFGIPVKIIDERRTPTPAGRADGLQPKTIETFKALGLAEPLLRRGVKIYDISFWNSTPASPVLSRSGRDIHYPPVVDVLEPFILLVHQGMVEGVFIDDLAARGVSVDRSCVFDSAAIVDESPNAEYPVEAVYTDLKNSGERRTVRAKYLVGCDGAHSTVRRSMPGVEMKGENTDVFWGVLDGVVDTDFPDLWSKCAISSHTSGTILCCPRERNMTRLYIELPSTSPASTPSRGNRVAKQTANADFIIRAAQAILRPYNITWKSIDWFGVYAIGQRVASAFSSNANRIFIAGDAGHTHSPKAAQGMNVSMHDTYNLAWKLAHVLQGIAAPSLLDTYASERRKIANDLIAFDHSHATALMTQDVKALVDNFKTNIRFISGVGAVYGANALNLAPTTVPGGLGGSTLTPGTLLPPARATRFIDSNPVDIQLDTPWARLGQFRIYFLAPDFAESKYFLDVLCELFTTPTFVLSRAATHSKSLPAPPVTDEDQWDQPSRYTTAAGRLYSPCLITSTPQDGLELSDLPPLLRDSRWCVYIDNLETAVSPLRRKWSRARIRRGETQVVVVRPDGYVGAVSKPWGAEEADSAGRWVEAYFAGFMAEKVGGREGRAERNGVRRERERVEERAERQRERAEERVEREREKAGREKAEREKAVEVNGAGEGEGEAMEMETPTPVLPRPKTREKSTEEVERPMPAETAAVMPMEECPS